MCASLRVEVVHETTAQSLDRAAPDITAAEYDRLVESWQRRSKRRLDFPGRRRQKVRLAALHYILQDFDMETDYNGAEVNVVNKRGQSPLFLAERHWPLAMTTIYKPSAAGDLLRELTTPDVVSKALEEWATIPSHVRMAVESLLQDALEKIASAEDRRDENPIIPFKASKP